MGLESGVNLNQLIQHAQSRGNTKRTDHSRAGMGTLDALLILNARAGNVIGLAQGSGAPAVPGRRWRP
jgi:hypothetical protein